MMGEGVRYRKAEGVIPVIRGCLDSLHTLLHTIGLAAHLAPDGRAPRHKTAHQRPAYRAPASGRVGW